MIKNIFLIFVAALFLMNSETVFSQRKSAPKKANVKIPKAAVKTPKKPAPVNEEEVFQLKLQETLKDSENWKEYTFVKDNFKAFFPRKPVLKEESFYDESLGKLQVSAYFGMGDDGLFAAAHFRLPYSINDDAVLRKLYQEISKGFLNDDEIKITESKDIQINGKSGLEINGVNFDDARSVEENPLIIVGESDKNRLLIVSYAERGDKIRIIGARELTPKERRDYEHGKFE